ncbi:acyl-ACP thioesterase domain-containing protein [uncultured Desulfosarcina sp.]|uniref:acyl-ACP thioesterase domain-containing protein n=1 Tax=uncultured Desulfosarcina sp. TaxID=218289 RepID=UPI002D1E3533|nr:acyl-ACP thioesterase domain-containing protein [uncultured Desulfosarcina sp.]
MNPRHTTAFSVHLHHIGSNGLARPSLFFDCFQDAASEQSALLEFSIRELMERGLTWVVSRYRVKVCRYPRWQERIRVTTWRSPP